MLLVLSERSERPPVVFDMVFRKIEYMSDEQLNQEPVKEFDSDVLESKVLRYGKTALSYGMGALAAGAGEFIAFSSPQLFLDAGDYHVSAGKLGWLAAGGLAGGYVGKKACDGVMYLSRRLATKMFTKTDERKRSLSYVGCLGAFAFASLFPVAAWTAAELEPAMNARKNNISLAVPRLGGAVSELSEIAGYNVQLIRESFSRDEIPARGSVTDYSRTLPPSPKSRSSLERQDWEEQCREIIIQGIFREGGWLYRGELAGRDLYFHFSDLTCGDLKSDLGHRVYLGSNLFCDYASLYWGGELIARWSAAQIELGNSELVFSSFTRSMSHSKCVEFPYRYGSFSSTSKFGVHSLIGDVIFDRSMIDAGIVLAFCEPYLILKETVHEGAVEKKTFNVRALDGSVLFCKDVTEPHIMLDEDTRQVLYVNEGSNGVARYLIDGTRESVDESKLMPDLRETLKLE